MSVEALYARVIEYLVSLFEIMQKIEKGWKVRNLKREDLFYE